MNQLQITNATMQCLSLPFYFWKTVTVWSEMLGWKFKKLDSSSYYCFICHFENKIPELLGFSHLMNRYNITAKAVNLYKYAIMENSQVS